MFHFKPTVDLLKPAGPVALTATSNRLTPEEKANQRPGKSTCHQKFLSQAPLDLGIQANKKPKCFFPLDSGLLSTTRGRWRTYSRQSGHVRQYNYSPQHYTRKKHGLRRYRTLLRNAGLLPMI